MNKTLNYISYQSFPAETANSLQTISNLKYLNRNNYKINLYFPLREKSSSDNLDTLKDYYLFDEDINILAISTSEIKISVIIDEENTLKAIKKLHTIFDLD